MAAADSSTQQVAEEDEEVRGGKPIGSWEFIDRPPTAAEVKELLESLPPVWGIRQADFVEYVQPLSQNKDLSVQKGTKDYHQVWNLYFTVAGRIAMITQAAILNGWSVSFEPEEFGERHGYVEYDDRIVYREYCHVKLCKNARGEWFPNEEQIDLGRKPGIAWVPNTGGAGAVSSNRFEKVETSARGRSIAAWGFGVIPGSGVASFDEMLMINDGKAANQRGRGQQDRQPAQPRVSRDEMESRLRVANETLRTLTGLSVEAANANTADYAKRTFNKDLPLLDSGAVDFASLKDGEMALFLRSMEGEVNKMKAQQEGLG